MTWHLVRQPHLVFPLALAVHVALGTPTASAETRVVVTLKPVHALIARVMDGVGVPRLLVSGSSSPHSFALKPSDSKALQSAQVFIRVSEDVEPFTRKILPTLPESVRVVTLIEAPGMTLLDKRTAATFETHAHGPDDHRGDGHGHDSAQGKGGDGHDDHDEEGHAGRDGHIWLDPENAKVIVAAAVKALAEAAPADAERLHANADRLLGEIDALARDLAERLAPARAKPFVVFHDSTQYLERRYGLSAVGSITLSPEVKPSAKRLRAIRAKIESLGAACVFAEPTFSTALVANVVEGTPARSGILDPEGLMIKEGPDAYFELMRGLAAGLTSCLAG